MLSHDNGLWKTLCEVMEKTPAMSEKPLFPWEVLYMGNPHVPGDYSSIARAAKFARSCKRVLRFLFMSMKENVVTLCLLLLILQGTAGEFLSPKANTRKTW